MTNKKNLANGLLGAPMSTTDTTLTLASGYASYMPAVPFSATITPFGQLSTMTNSEIVLVTAISGDVLTVTRAQKSTTANIFKEGDVLSNGIYTDDQWEISNIDGGSEILMNRSGTASVNTHLPVFTDALNGVTDSGIAVSASTISANSSTMPSASSGGATLGTIYHRSIADSSLYGQYVDYTRIGNIVFAKTDYNGSGGGVAGSGNFVPSGATIPYGYRPAVKARMTGVIISSNNTNGSALVETSGGYTSGTGNGQWSLCSHQSGWGTGQGEPHLHGAWVTADPITPIATDATITLL